MINFDTYSLLKKFLDNGTFDGLDKIHAERACLKYEEAQEARKLKQEIHNTMMKNLIYDVIARADKPLRPTEIQFILYREIGKEYSCATIACYCGKLWIDDRKLTFTRKGNRSYYSIREKK